MAFDISKNQAASSPLSETNKTSSVTSHLYLKKSASDSASALSSARRGEHDSQSLDRDVVLRRIRHHKRMEKARRNLRAVFGGPAPLAADSNDDNDMSVYEHKLLQMADVFCSP